MQARIEWAYDGGARDGWYNAVGGDADPLPNGNVLIVGGSATSSTSKPRIMEVTRTGRLVWRVWLSQGPGVSAGAFQAHRFPALTEAVGP